MKNMWDQRYSQDSYFYGTEPNDFLREQRVRLPPNSDVLCLAEGEGRNAVFLACQGHHVTAVDISDVGLKKAESLAASHHVPLKTICLNLDDYKIEPDRWDAIISIWCHVPQNLRARLHREAVSALRSGGIFLLEAYTPAQIPLNTGGPKDPDLLPTLAQIRQELQGLVEIVGRECQREIHEGQGHTGTSEVVQYLARK